jgi:TRAP-type C4-dicarboxylate transport system permease small subunit
VEKILDKVFQRVWDVCKVMLVIQVAVTIFVVTGRYVFNWTPGWGEQLTLLLLVWIGMLSAAITLRENSHVRVTLIENVLPAKAVQVIDFLGEIVLFLFFLGLFVSGYRLVRQTLPANYPGLGISKAWLYAAVPVSGVLLAVAAIERGLNMLRGRSPSVKGDDSLQSMQCTHELAGRDANGAP